MKYIKNHAIFIFLAIPLLIFSFIIAKQITDNKSVETPNELRVLDKQQSTNNYETFRDAFAKIEFQYPNIYTITKVTDNEFALAQKNNKDENGYLLIENSTVAQANTEIHKIMGISGKVTQIIKLPKHVYDAQIYTISNGKNSMQLFYLKRNNQVILLKPPKDNSIDPQILINIVNSFNVPIPIR